MVGGKRVKISTIVGYMFATLKAVGGCAVRRIPSQIIGVPSNPIQLNGKFALKSFQPQAKMVRRQGEALITAAVESAP